MLFKKIDASSWVKILAISACVLCFVLSLQTIAFSQDNTFLTSRISRLESENSTLRSRISRLESDVSRIGSTIGLNYTYSSTPESGVATASPSSAADPMFDRLATLVIELRDRIITLENQVAELQESQY
jgi:outer membrane murein-binding lipoprotein Lpp